MSTLQEARQFSLRDKYFGPERTHREAKKGRKLDK